MSDRQPNPMGSTSTQTPPLADILAALGEDTARLMRQEFALAKAETREEVRHARNGVVELVAAMMAAQVGLIMLSFALEQWLDNSIDPGWAFLIIAVVWLVLSGALAAAGARMLQRTEVVPPRTAQTVQQLPANLKGK